jgi:hypothetical protein
VPALSAEGQARGPAPTSGFSFSEDEIYAISNWKIFSIKTPGIEQEIFEITDRETLLPSSEPALRRQP